MTPRGAYMRVGTSAEPMPQDQIDRLFAIRTRNSIGRIVSNRQDLSFEQFVSIMMSEARDSMIISNGHWNCLQMKENTIM